MNAEELIEVHLSEICVNPSQPRRQFAADDLQDLADSIVSVGIIHPPVVRPCKSGYELISGERRFRAAQLAGLKKIAVHVRRCTPVLSAEAALIENIQRVDLNPIEIAKALRSLLMQSKQSQEELSRRIGKKRSTIANYLRLLSLPQEIQDSIEGGTITMGHAKAILTIEGSEGRLALLEKVIAGQLNVRETELAAIRGAPDNLQKKAPKPLKYDIHLDTINEMLQSKLGTKVTILESAGRGSIKIDYYSLEDLNRLLDFFGINLN